MTSYFLQGAPIVEHYGHESINLTEQSSMEQQMESTETQMGPPIDYEIEDPMESMEQQGFNDVDSEEPTSSMEGFTVENMCGDPRKHPHGDDDEEHFTNMTMEGMHCGSHKDEEEEQFSNYEHFNHGSKMCSMKSMKYRIVHMDMKLNILVILIGLVAVMCLYCCMKKK